MAITWNISADGVARTAADWGITGIRRSRRSQAVDTCTFTASGRALDAEPLFAHASTVTILRGNTPWFVGRVTQAPGSGSSKSEDQTYTLSGPWWYLENLVCRQHWHINGSTGVTALSTRLILGQSLTGTRITTATVLTETLNFATDAGAPFLVGIIDPNTLYPPFDEVKDVTCANVIQQILRWHPDCVAWFDYATSPHPTLHIRRRANLTAATQKLGTAPMSRIGEITAREDLKPPAVVIIYEVTSSNNGQSQLDLQVDSAPDGATGMEFGAVVATIAMRGVNATTISQRVLTEAIIDDLVGTNDNPGSSSSDAVEFLMKVDAFIAAKAADPQITADGITITQISRTIANASAQVPSNPAYPNGAHTTDTYHANLTNALLGGNIADWMFSQYGIKSQVQRIDYTCTLDSGDGSSGSPVGTPIKRSLEITATNAVTGSYTTLTNYDAGDTVPTGLAAAYYAALSQLQYSGSITLAEAEVTGAVALGQVLNLTEGAQSAWASMRALIVGEEADVDRGETTITFGPAEHLSPADLVSLMRVTRPGSGNGRSGDGPSAIGTANSAARVSGGGGNAQGAALAGVQQPIQGPTRNSLGQDGSSSAAPPADFSLYNASTTSGGSTTLKVGVRFGTVTCYLIADGVAPWPSNYTSANSYKYEFEVTGDGSVWIAVTNDTSGSLNKVSAIALANGTMPPEPDGVFGVKPLGAWTVDTSATPSKLTILSGEGANGAGNLYYEFIGGIQNWRAS